MLKVDGGNWFILRKKIETHMDSPGFNKHFIKSNTPLKSMKMLKQSQSRSMLTYEIMARQSGRKVQGHRRRKMLRPEPHLVKSF